MESSESIDNVCLDLNNPTFQENLFGLQSQQIYALKPRVLDCWGGGGAFGGCTNKGLGC